MEIYRSDLSDDRDKGRWGRSEVKQQWGERESRPFFTFQPQHTGLENKCQTVSFHDIL